MISHRNLPSILVLVGALLGTVLVAAPLAQATTVTIVNGDGPGEGFNDTTPTAPVGGNTGVTIGQQRLNVFQFAGNTWAARLSSTVPIRVGASFNPLSCTSSSGVLGSAGPNAVFRDFTGAIEPNTWYAVALANALHGSDLDTADDIGAQFNSNVGTPGCLDGLSWYYGLDGNPPPSGIDLATVVLHEMGHGLGFLTFVNLSSGTKLMGLDDTFMLNLEDHVTAKLYPTMTNAERVAASKDTGNLHWVGPNVKAASGALTAGKVGDHVRMYAPNPQQGGSSVSHWDTALTPNQLMEPSYTAPIHNPGLEIPFFEDIGWALSLSANTPHDFNGDGKADILWRNASGDLALWLMNGASVSSMASLGIVSTDWTVAGVGDFNGDGKADILWRHTSGAVFLWLMNGASASSTASLGMVDTGWAVAGVGDFNGDGKADILWRHTSGAVFLWLMDGTSASSTASLGMVGTDWTVAGIGDFNGDGKADILWRQTSGAVFLWLMNGTSVSSTASLGTVGTDWTVADVGDFNGDGKADILWRQTSGAVFLWLMNGTSATSTASLGMVGTDWTIANVADFNGDGKADILWRQTSGALVMWLMNGTSASSTGSLGTVSTDWVIQ
jgi:hypothetical protein